MPPYFLSGYLAIISDADWAEISEAVGGLPDAARDEIDAEISTYSQDACKEFEVRCSDTKRLVRQAYILAKDLASVVSKITQSENYRCYNTGDAPLGAEEVKQLRDSAAQLCRRLDLDRKRFERKSRRDRERVLAVAFVRKLLEIRHRYLNTGWRRRRPLVCLA
jgi:hypothetical protein